MRLSKGLYPATSRRNGGWCKSIPLRGFRELVVRQRSSAAALCAEEAAVRADGRDVETCERVEHRGLSLDTSDLSHPSRSGDLDRSPCGAADGRKQDDDILVACWVQTASERRN